MTVYYLLLKKSELNFQASHLCILRKVVVQQVNLQGLLPSTFVHVEC